VPKVYTGSYDRWHEDYERGRPGWPPEALELPGLPPTATVLDLGAGTGKLTRLLLRRFADVVAVEPDPGMLRLLLPLGLGARVLTGSAEKIPLEDASVDAVFAAETFHVWDGERALAEVARVLRPGGVFVLMWNLPAGPTEPSLEAVDRLVAERGPTREELGYDPVDLDATRYQSGEWRRPFADAPFEELREARLPNPQSLDRDGLLAFLRSMGWISELPEAERQAWLDEIGSLLTAPEYRLRWETHVHWTTRRRASRSRS
jgi:SAM-dependent methyltransferase